MLKGILDLRAMGYREKQREKDNAETQRALRFAEKINKDKKKRGI